MYNNHKLQDQDLQLTADNQIVELGDNELDSISGGVFGAAMGTVIALNQGKRGWSAAGDAFSNAGTYGSIGLGVGLLSGFPPVALGGLAVGAALSIPKA
jgi:hypothetical protein